MEKCSRRGQLSNETGPSDYLIIRKTTQTRKRKRCIKLTLEKQRQHKTFTGREVTAVAKPLTIDMKAVPIQGERTQLGDTMSLMAQLPVEPLSVQPWAHEVRVEGADHVHSSGCSMILKPEEERTLGCGILKRALLGVESKKVKVRRLREC